MLHGKMDAQVPFAQSEVMDQALTRAQIPHRFAVVPDADHPFSAVKDRALLLQETLDLSWRASTDSGARRAVRLRRTRTGRAVTY
jgi:dipeptidyl aminopeptidase/acylaminoacyl peptidase